MITAYPVLLSYSLDTTVSRLDFLIQVQYSVLFVSLIVTIQSDDLMMPGN